VVICLNRVGGRKQHADDLVTPIAGTAGGYRYWRAIAASSRGIGQVLGAQDPYFGRVSARSGEPQGLGGYGLFEQVPDVPGVPEVLPARRGDEDRIQPCGYVITELEAGIAGHAGEDGGQLLVGVGGEVDGSREAGGQAGVGL
jgi:hypothetical protein